MVEVLQSPLVYQANEQRSVLSFELVHAREGLLELFVRPPHDDVPVGTVERREYFWVRLKEEVQAFPDTLFLTAVFDTNSRE
jgi:hypothetical protein